MVIRASSNGCDTEPLEAEELADALADISSKMEKYKGPELTVLEAADIISVFGALEGQELEEALTARGMTDLGYDQICALRHDIEHQAGPIVVEEKTRTSPKKTDGKNGRAAKKKSKASSTAIRSKAAGVSDGLMLSAQEAMETMLGTKKDEWKRRLEQLMRETPVELAGNIPSLIGGLHEAQAGERLDAYYENVERQTGVTRGLLIRWALFHEAYPFALDWKEKEEQKERVVSAMEQEVLLRRSMPLAWQDAEKEPNVTRFKGKIHGGRGYRGPNKM